MQEDFKNLNQYRKESYKKDEKQAMKLYADLPGKKAELCMSCPGYCESACPYGVSARSLMAMAHQNLSFDRESFA